MRTHLHNPLPNCPCSPPTDRHTHCGQLWATHPRRVSLTTTRATAGDQQPPADAKRAAAELLIDTYVRSNSAVAFGNGELVGMRLCSDPNSNAAARDRICRQLFYECDVPHLLQLPPLPEKQVNQAIACLGDRLMNKKLEVGAGLVPAPRLSKRHVPPETALVCKQLPSRTRLPCTSHPPYCCGCSVLRAPQNVTLVAASSAAAHEGAFFGVPQQTLEEAGGRVSRRQGAGRGGIRG